MHQPDCTVDDVELLKIGRQFRLSEHAKLTLGRHQRDNEALREAADRTHIVLRAIGVPGPLGLVTGTPKDDDLHVAGAIVAAYGKGKDQEHVEVVAETPAGEQRFSITPMPRVDSEQLIV